MYAIAYYKWQVVGVLINIYLGKNINAVISYCGKNLYLVQGGNYQFIHCTAVSISNNYIQHKDPVLTLSDKANNISKPLDALFRNCIFWGENGLVENEVVVAPKTNPVFNVNFDRALWKVQTVPQNITSTEIINNQDPLFDSIDVNHNYYNFRLKPVSPAVNKGTSTAAITIDLDGKTRPLPVATKPDLGCYETNQ